VDKVKLTQSRKAAEGIREKEEKKNFFKSFSSSSLRPCVFARDKSPNTGY
jgi:hypothetical protein